MPSVPLLSLFLVATKLKMSLTLRSPSSSTLSLSSLQEARFKFFSSRSISTKLAFHCRRPIPRILAVSNSSSVDSGLTTELDAISSFSEIVPDTVIFDDFEKFPPTAATVSSSLLLGICGLPDTVFRNAVDMALADSGCSVTREDVHKAHNLFFIKEKSVLIFFGMAPANRLEWLRAIKM